MGGPQSGYGQGSYTPPTAQGGMGLQGQGDQSQQPQPWQMQPWQARPMNNGMQYAPPNPFGGQGMNNGGTANPVVQPGQSDIATGAPPGMAPPGIAPPAGAPPVTNGVNPNVNAGNASAWAALQNLRSRGFAG